MKRKAVILDRDDTIIKDYIYLNDPTKVEYLPHAFDALKRLRDNGYHFIIATNQSGVPRGLVQLHNLWAIHEKIKKDFSRNGIDILAFYYAPFMTDSNHYYRKPNPGMLDQAAIEWNLDMPQSWMIGDRMTDVAAGHRAGCRSIILGNKSHHTDYLYKKPEARVQSLQEMADFILENPLSK